MDDDVRTLVMQKADAATIRRHCTGHGMKLLRQDGAARVCAARPRSKILLPRSQSF